MYSHFFKESILFLNSQISGISSVKYQFSSQNNKFPISHITENLKKKNPNQMIHERVSSVRQTMQRFFGWVFTCKFSQFRSGCFLATCYFCLLHFWLNLCLSGSCRVLEPYKFRFLFACMLPYNSGKGPNPSRIGHKLRRISGDTLGSRINHPLMITKFTRFSWVLIYDCMNFRIKCTKYSPVNASSTNENRPKKQSNAPNTTFKFQGFMFLL